MKRVFVALFALMFAISLGHAQKNERVQRFEENKTKMDAFFKDIGVNETQMAQIEDVRTEMQTEMQKLRGKGRSDENRDQMNKLRDEHAARMKNILTEEQYAQYEKKVQERSGPQHQRMKKPN